MMLPASDCHVHSAFSHDGHYSMAELGEAAVSAGLDYITITDHADDCVFNDFSPDSLGKLSAQVGHVLEPYCDKTALYGDYIQAKEHLKGRTQLLLGVEIGGWNHDAEKGREIAARWPFDYILASIHNLKGQDDFYVLDYRKTNFPEIAERYIAESAELVRMGGFDALAHFGYFLRYMARDGLDVSKGFLSFEAQLTELFRLMIEKGIALEVNTSGVFYNFNDFIPSMKVFQIYRSLGGELVTMGSDSHTTSGVGAGLKDAREMLASLGYRCYTVFIKRKPVMLPLV